MNEKKIYVISNFDTNLDVLVNLTDEQYKAINWFIDTFDGCDISNLCISKIDDSVARDID